MSQNKTHPTKQSVLGYLNAIKDETRRRDCKKMVKIMKEVSGVKPKMWGDSIVGFGEYHYKYDSGREGDFLRLGFSNRKSAITIYILPGYTNFDHILKDLGKYKKGKSCLYIKRLDDVDEKVLKKLIKAGWADMRKLYPL